MKSLNVIFISSLALLTGCLDSGDDESEQTVSYGYVIDSGVEQLRYESSSFNDPTTPTEGLGQFKYIEGESTTFYFLGLNLGTATPSFNNSIVTPSSLLGINKNHAETETFLASRQSDTDAQTLTNMLVLLQSFDEDQDPSNGIKLPTQFDDISNIDGIEYDNLLGNLDLTLNSTDFRADALTQLQKISGRESRQLTSEDDAIAHYLESLKSLEAITDYVGRWGMRSGAHGDLGAIYTFNSDGSVFLTEYDNCPSNLWGSTEALLLEYCTPVNIEQTFTTSGNGFELVSDNFTDTCLPISINSHEAVVTCNFYGSGLGNETVRLQRAPTDFSQAPLDGTYQLLDVGDIIRFTSSNDDSNTGTGTSNTGNNPTENFAWSKTDSSISISGDFSAQLNFEGYIKGSWLISDSASNIINVMRNSENINNANLLDFDGFYAVFDANPESPTEGQCKEVRIKNINISPSNQILHYANASGVDYQCDYPRDWFDEDGTQATKTSTISSFTANAMTISGANQDLQCYLLGIDDYQLDTFYVACETSTGSFDIEMWKPL